MSTTEEISKYLQQGRANNVKELVAKALEEGLSAQEILNDGLLAGMSIIGEKFKNNEVYVPEVLIAARAMNAGMEILKPVLVSANVQSKGKAVLGTVKGDLHDIGKNLVRIMLEGKGIEVVDLGVNVSPETFVDAAIRENADIYSLLGSSYDNDDGYEGRSKGSRSKGRKGQDKAHGRRRPRDTELLRFIGADYYSPDAASAGDVALQICQA